MELDSVLAKLVGASIDHGIDAHESPTAAVAAILRQLPGQSGAELFFIRRAEQPGDPWSGHVAFPGGRREAEDASLLDTAIRETREEVGLALTKENLVARLPDVPAFIRSKKGTLVVSVFVFAVRSDLPIVPQTTEVATTLWVPLALLKDSVGKATFEMEYDGRKFELPYVYLEPGQHRLWGMTYGMLISLLTKIADT